MVRVRLNLTLQKILQATPVQFRDTDHLLIANRPPDICSAFMPGMLSVSPAKNIPSISKKHTGPTALFHSSKIPIVGCSWAFESSRLRREILVPVSQLALLYEVLRDINQKLKRSTRRRGEMLDIACILVMVVSGFGIVKNEIKPQ